MAAAVGSEEALTSPLELRAPLQVTKNDTQQELIDDHSSKIRPLLYRMFVACHILRLGTEARFTALVLLHRYAIAAKQQPKDSLCESKWVAAACLFLACKAEEEPRRLRDVINLAWMILSRPSSSMEENKSRNNDSTPRQKDQVYGSGDGTERPDSDDYNEHLEILEISNDPPDLNEEYWQAKKKIVQTEQIVLRWLAFDVSVSHPHRAIRMLMKHETSVTKDKLQSAGYRRLNDAMFHGPSLTHGVFSMACAAVVLAIEEVENGQNAIDHSKRMVLSSHLSKLQWWKVYQVSDEDLKSAKEDLVQATKLLETNGDNA